jgi:lysozyme family protein
MTYNWTTTSDGAMKQIQKNAQFKIEASVDENGSLGPNTIKAMNAAQDQNQLLQNID